MNLDGTSATAALTLPRIELHAGPAGWTCICHRQNGTSVKLPLGPGPSTEDAKHSAVEAMLALGTPYQAQLRELLRRSSG